LAINRNSFLMLLVGLLTGATVTAVYMERKQGQSKDVFEHKTRCLQVAQRYEKEHTALPEILPIVLQVEYSPERNSCVAEMIEERLKDKTKTYLVVDLLSGEEAIVGMCDRQRGECNGAFESEMNSKQNTKFAEFRRKRP